MLAARNFPSRSFRPEILDPTGVGDAFRGGFLRGLQLGLDWQTIGQMGSLAATYCLEQRGTQLHNYTPAEFVAVIVSTLMTRVHWMSFCRKARNWYNSHLFS